MILSNRPRILNICACPLYVLPSYNWGQAGWSLADKPYISLAQMHLTEHLLKSCTIFSKLRISGFSISNNSINCQAPDVIQTWISNNKPALENMAKQQVQAFGFDRMVIGE